MRLCVAASLIVWLLSVATKLAEVAGEGRFEPYNVMGVSRRASQADIRAAYKKLAKEWHPDKVAPETKDEAEARFIEINRAYELLSDPDRRRKYDNYGVTEDTPNFRAKNNKADAYASFGRFDHTFHDFSGSSGGFRFHFDSGGGSGPNNGAPRRIFHKQTISNKAYYNTVLPNSKKQPYLILFYSDWCFTCLRVEPIWTRLSEELEPVGFGIATVHTEYEKELARKVSVKELPHLVLLLDGKVIHYKDPQFSAIKAIEFIRRKMPYKLVESVDDSNVDEFLNGWMDNRVRVLIFGRIEVVRLRYLTTAFKFRNRALFGLVNMDDPKADRCRKRFGIAASAASVDTLMLFQEDPTAPVVSVAMKDIPLSTLTEVVEANMYLQLPRLSSQSVFDSLCPPEASRSRRRLCVVLVNRSDEGPALAEGRRRAMREFLSRFKFSADRVRFAYILQDKQVDFVRALLDGTSSSADSLVASSGPKDVAIVWRVEDLSIRFEWLQAKWQSLLPEDEEGDHQLKLNQSMALLRTTVQAILSSASTDKLDKEMLSRQTVIKELMDEHAHGLFVRVANKMLEAVEALRESISKDELLPAVSLVVTVGFIVAGGYVMSYLVKMEEESVRKQLGDKGLKVDKKGKIVPELKVHELRAETYNGMVRLLKPGCRTLVLIVDRESKEKLVPKFYKHAWPYRRNKTLMFGFLYIEKGLPWFKKILNLTLPEPRDININPKNCIGTVLSLNGHRRYFCMYHAKHPEGSRRKLYTANNGAVAGAFMGFDSELEDSGSDGERDVEGGAPGGGGQAGSDSRAKKTPLLLDSPDHLPIFEDQLLDGFQMWLDRLFEGSTYRYHINYWPEFPISPANFTASRARE